MLGTLKHVRALGYNQEHTVHINGGHVTVNLKDVSDVARMRIITATYSLADAVQTAATEKCKRCGDIRQTVDHETLLPITCPDCQESKG